MSALSKMLEGKETKLARAVLFTATHCTADKQLGEQAAAELARLQEIEKAAEVSALRPSFASFQAEAYYYRDAIAKIAAALKGEIK